MWKNTEVEYGNQKFLVKFEEYKGFITVRLCSDKLPYKQLNKKCQYMGYYLRGKSELIKSAIMQYNEYLNASER